jgi:hypothetical protein
MDHRRIGVIITSFPWVATFLGVICNSEGQTPLHNWKKSI